MWESHDRHSVKELKAKGDGYIIKPLMDSACERFFCVYLQASHFQLMELNFTGSAVKIRWGNSMANTSHIVPDRVSSALQFYFAKHNGSIFGAQDDMDSKMKDIMIALKTTAAKKKFEILKAEGSDSVFKEAEQILERLPIAQALDPPQKRGKGRPSTKRKTSSVESYKTRVGARRKPRNKTQETQESHDNHVSYRRKWLRSK
ncbi:hypothetical protein BCR33DRAFT_862772 [Rhizoclosmatium globosum]|uniref:Uncharacterized protein n=1 Tax=Rhizoclosmatium globosum TaxID=329046 RepID=A0A1Y2ADW9_9FUNG|nr:hypothetical protein BCR33DRAFT_862772 [Rhizoclosmatium globosum]|eukprot:ORY20480.1 hypothetical protein BCR33DRAFT_862772 [Rhizoclosmatium globosum]